MISILDYVFTVVFYMMRWIKLDIICICFEEFMNQLNLLYICICLHKLGRGLIFFVGLSLAQWAVSDFFIFFYILNFSVVFFIHL
jgi:hypothetical protein